MLAPLDRAAPIGHKWGKVAEQGEKWAKREPGVKSSSRFMGTYYRVLDAKGRLQLPPRYLEVIASAERELGGEGRGSFWLTCLYGRVTAYLPATWEQTVEQLCSIKGASRKLSDFKTRFIGLGEELFPDAQGRVRIPQSLVRQGGLVKDVVLVGILEKFEVWDQERFEAVPNEDVSEELAASGVEIFL